LKVLFGNVTELAKNKENFKLELITKIAERATGSRGKPFSSHILQLGRLFQTRLGESTYANIIFFLSPPFQSMVVDFTKAAKMNQNFPCGMSFDEARTTRVVEYHIENDIEYLVGADVAVPLNQVISEVEMNLKNLKNSSKW